jgi:hypothetical protein
VSGLEMRERLVEKSSGLLHKRWRRMVLE